VLKPLILLAVADRRKKLAASHAKGHTRRMAGKKKGLHLSEDEPHVSDNELHDYFKPALSELRETEIEAHLAECRPCAERARAMQTLLAVMDDWPASARGGSRHAPPPRKAERVAPR